MFQAKKEMIGTLKVGEMCVITTNRGKETIDKVSLVGKEKERLIKRLEKLTIEIPVIIINGKASDISKEMLHKALIENNLKVLACPEGIKIDKVIATNEDSNL